MKRLFSILLVALTLLTVAPNLNTYAAETNLGSATAANIENLINASIKSYKTSVDLSQYNIRFTQVNVEKLEEIYVSVLEENPTYFHLNGYSINYKQFGDILTLNLKYEYTKTQHSEMLQEIEQSANAILKDIKGEDLSQLEIALILHDKLAVLCEYDYENYLKYEQGDKDAIPYNSYNMYGALVNNIAVCQGYSFAYKYLLNKMGVNAGLCKSDELGHMWNTVEIDGQNYHVDITYDDPVYDVTGRVNHEYFLLSTNAIKQKGHDANDLSDITPTNTKYEDYFWQSVKTQFCYFDEKLYYIDNDTATLDCYDNNQTKEVTSVKDKWYKTDTTFFIGNYSKLSTDGEFLYYNLSDTIYSFNPKTLEKSVVLKPDLSQYQNFSIFGFKAQNGIFYYDLFNSNVYKPYTKKLYGQTFNYSNSLNRATVTLSNSKYTYSNAYKKPTVKVVCDGKVLVNGTDYEVIYKNNINVGMATVTVTGIGIYKDSVTKTFKITPKSISSVNITPVGNKVYTGKQIKPTISVKDGKINLVLNKDYTIHFGTNKSTGKGTITVKGKGNYNFEKKIFFKIVPKKVSLTKASGKKAAVYIKYKKATGASGYQIAYSKSGSSKFKLKTTKSLTKTISKLKRKKTYKIKVRAYKIIDGKKVYGEWSKVKKVKTK